MRLIVDIDIIIDYLRGGVIWENILESINKDCEFYIATVVILELFSGRSTIDDEVSIKILDFLQIFNEIDLNKDIAKKAGELFRDVNRNLGIADYIIAASALVTGSTIITLNKKHFEQIPRLIIYPL